MKKSLTILTVSLSLLLVACTNNESNIKHHSTQNTNSQVTTQNHHNNEGHHNYESHHNDHHTLTNSMELQHK